MFENKNSIIGDYSVSENSSDCAERRRPNILWICTDQQRYDTIAALGNTCIITPNIDRLCAEGVSFNRTYCQNPLCTPSRASFLSGLYPSATHANRNGNSHYPVEGPCLITRHLADAGYTCGLVGKLHLASAWHGLEQRTNDGYSIFRYSHSPYQHCGTNLPGSPLPPLGQPCGNAYIDWLREEGVTLGDVFELNASGQPVEYRCSTAPELRQTTWCVSEAMRFIQNQREAQPWLLSLNIFDPHPPMDGLESLIQQYLNSELPEPCFTEADLILQERLNEAGVVFQSKVQRPNTEWRRTIASYYAMIELVDREIGRLLDALDKSGERDNTVIIFCSDHGEMLGDHGLMAKGCRFYEGLTRVPLIISCPRYFRQGVSVDDLVELTDLAPTIAELSGVTLPVQHGRSLLGYLEKDASPPPPKTFVRCEYLQTLDMEVAPGSEGKSHCFGTMIRDERWKMAVYHGHGMGELYDMDNDPNESINRWDDPACGDILSRLFRQSFDAFVQCSDPGPPRIGRY